MSLSAGLRVLLFVLGVLVLLPLMLEPAAALAARGLLRSQASWTGAQHWAVFLAVAIPTAVAARLERRPFGDYGYPRRRAGARLTEGFASRLRGVGPANVARVPSGDCRQRHWVLARGVGADDRLQRREAAGDPVPARTADRRIPGVGSAVRLDPEADRKSGMRSSVVMPALIGLAAVLVHVRFSVPGRTASPPDQQTMPRKQRSVATGSA